MSIYATTFSLDADDHTGSDTDMGGPIAYQGSHVLPSDDNPRGGYLDVGVIPGFIHRPGRPPLDDGPEDWPYHPWLRVSVNTETVVLTRDQVAGLRAEIDRWLEHTG